MKTKVVEIFDKVYGGVDEYCHMHQEVDYSYEFVIKAIKESYNQALKDALNNVVLEDKKIEYTGVRSGGFYIEKVIDKDSILNLKIK